VTVDLSGRFALCVSPLELAGADGFIGALALHRHPQRETDPPVV